MHVCRPSAAVLMSFLAHAGYRMAAVYGRQFAKLLAHLEAHFLPALEAKAVKNGGGCVVFVLVPAFVGLAAACCVLCSQHCPCTHCHRCFADLRAVGTRLQTYIATRAYLQEPEGRTLKRVDESSVTRA
jgi:hypothetical protein